MVVEPIKFGWLWNRDIAHSSGSSENARFHFLPPQGSGTKCSGQGRWTPIKKSHQRSPILFASDPQNFSSKQLFKGY
jgi:hypothetical protein